MAQMIYLLVGGLSAYTIGCLNSYLKRCNMEQMSSGMSC